MIHSHPMRHQLWDSSTFSRLHAFFFCCVLLSSLSPLSAAAIDTEGYLNRSRSWSGPQSFYVPRVGRVRVNFPSDLEFTESSSSPYGIKVKTLVGTVAGSSERILISYSTRVSSTPSSSNENGRVTREILFNVRNPRTGRISYVRVTAGSDEALKVSSVPSTLLSAVNCGSENAAPANLARISTASASSNGSSASSSRAPAITIESGPTIRVAFVADARYSRKFGDRTEQHIVTMLNQVNTIYRRDLGLSITPILVAREKHDGANLNSFDSSGLLDGFAVLTGRSRYGNADIYHLLTGKDLSDNIIGLANLPGACAPSKSTRVSLSQNLNSAIDYMTVAHEIGHNLSADHDTATFPQTIMFPSLPVDDVRFSAASRSQISAFKSYSDIQRCLNAPVPARNSVALTTTLTSSGHTSLAVSMPTGNDSCSVLLEASQNSDFASSRKVYLTSMESLSLRVFSKVNRSSNRRRRIFVRATATCGAAESSATASISPTRIRARLPATSPNAWASYFINSFR